MRTHCKHGHDWGKYRGVNAYGVEFCKLCKNKSSTKSKLRREKNESATNDNRNVRVL